MLIIVGLLEEQGKWEKMVAARQALSDAGIPIPPEIQQYFKEMGEGSLVSGYSKEVLGQATRGVKIPGRKVVDPEHGEIFLINVAEIPAGVTEILVHEVDE